MNKKQQAIEEIRRVASKLGTSKLSQREFQENSKMSLSTIKGWFGSWNNAIEASGLITNPPGFWEGQSEPRLNDEELLLEIVRLTRHLEKQPTMNDMSAFGNFSPTPYRTRWGSWGDALKVAYARYGFPDANSSASSEIPNSKSFTTPPKQGLNAQSRSRRKTVNRVQYGEPMDFRGLRHAPINEQGVVYMFGMVSKELGFVIESVRTAFPDCEGKRCVDEKRQLWEQVYIEFEFKSSNFREHGHDLDGCDVIVCWLHDWDDCPLEVVELKSAIQYLPT